jgi:hypothetical protein
MLDKTVNLVFPPTTMVARTAVISMGVGVGVGVGGWVWVSVNMDVDG